MSLDFKDYDREYIVSEEVIIKDTDTKAKIEKTIIVLVEDEEGTEITRLYMINGSLYNPKEIRPVYLTDSETFMIGKQKEEIK